MEYFFIDDKRKMKYNVDHLDQRLLINIWPSCTFWTVFITFTEWSLRKGANFTNIIRAAFSNESLTFSSLVNFTNILREIFSNKSFAHRFFCTFCRKNIDTKAAHKMLVKLTPGVNFTNILCATYTPKRY